MIRGYIHSNANLKLEDVIYNEKRKMGYGFVLAGLISGNRFWEQPFDANKIFKKSVTSLKPRYSKDETTDLPLLEPVIVRPTSPKKKRRGPTLPYPMLKRQKMNDFVSI